MKIIPEFKTRADLFRQSFYNIKVNGLYLEFGVASGNTINYIAKLNPNTKIYGFDSFEGLPEDFSFTHKKGRFNKDKRVPKVEKNVHLISGWFKDTLNPFLKEYSEKVAFIHMDADVYSSTKFVLHTLAKQKRLQKGTVIQFDEILFYEIDINCSADELIAFQEFITNFNIEYKMIGFSLSRYGKSIGIQVSIIIEEIRYQQERFKGEIK